MANTFKFGNGKWAAKAGSVLAYNDENDNFKPLPFTFTRASTATRVNESGLIESVASGVPRIDFLDNADGHLLLEPSATALNNFSEQINNAYWTKANCTVTADQTASPSGYVDAELVLDDTSNSQHVITRSIAVTSGNKYTASFFLKSAGYTTSAVRMGVGSLWTGGTGPTVEFDLVALTGTVVDGSGVTFNIEDYGNGWRRCSVTGTCVTSGSTVLSLYVKQYASYIGNGTDGVYAWGANITATGYATSYIPTQGSAVTRVADACNNGGNNQVINSTEGVLYFEGSAIANDGTFKRISVGTSDDLFANSIQLRYNTDDNSITYQFRVGSVYEADLTITANTTNVNKIACVWKINRFEIWVNGVKEAQDTSGSVPPSNTFNSLFFGKSSNALLESFKGNVKDIKIYNTALTDAELATLTTI